MIDIEPVVVGPLEAVWILRLSGALTATKLSTVRQLPSNRIELCTRLAVDRIKYRGAQKRQVGKDPTLAIKAIMVLREN